MARRIMCGGGDEQRSSWPCVIKKQPLAKKSGLPRTMRQNTDFPETNRFASRCVPKNLRGVELSSKGMVVSLFQAWSEWRSPFGSSLNFLHVKPFKPSLKGQEGVLFGLGLNGLKGTLFRPGMNSLDFFMLHKQ